ncbi:outer membrane biogenesis protein BamB [Planctopirus ephydatiae]|uniref:Outer membrane biogenesis protein BamB n=1 Tax=Planctopirus ephydatiae TaxID=2528019 RepID=A0A518GKZ1_9PLAN|nr:PQQ-binding-like beta-propeller repeat protein [Planctopirus ephydatiae]QDV29111.1 outer membrane biogenesis protein BamB [Planctopirus ephydatiae]
MKQQIFSRWLFVCASVLISAISAGAFAEDWPQWMGLNRDGRWHETGLLREFPADGAKFAWRVPVGMGYSGPAVAGGKVFLTDYVKKTGEVKNDPGTRNILDGQERIRCFNEANGKLLWEHAYDAPYSISYPSGPRCTPTVDRDLVYALGAEGVLTCLQVQDGKVVWSKNFKKDFGVETPIWGFSGHPLVDGDQLICVVGAKDGLLISFDKKTGTEKWRSLSASEPGYGSPVIIEAGGVRQLLIWTPVEIAAVNPSNGNVYWKEPLQPDYAMSIMAPQKSGDLLFASGIGNVGAVYELDRTRPGAKLLWRGTNKTALYAANATPLIVDGVIYGCDCNTSQFRAVELSTGKRLWETFAPTTNERRARHGTAFLVQNGDHYFLMSETGELIIARLSAHKYDEISRTRILEPTGEAFGRPVVWSHPAFANGHIYARNDKELVAVDLRDHAK